MPLTGLEFLVAEFLIVVASPDVSGLGVAVAAPELFGGEVAEISLLRYDEMCSLRSLSEDWDWRRFFFFIGCTNADLNRNL